MQDVGLLCTIYFGCYICATFKLRSCLHDSDKLITVILANYSLQQEAFRGQPASQPALTNNATMHGALGGAFDYDKLLVYRMSKSA
jgi:hypothetical protein